LGTLGEITTTSLGGNNATAYFYFFFDWEVDAPGTLCEGPRTEVVVRIGTVGLPEADAANGMRVWPNPSDGTLTIGFAGIEGPVDIGLLDITGRTVMTRRTRALPGEPLRLDLDGLAAGEYLLRARYDHGTSTHRVVLR